MASLLCAVLVVIMASTWLRSESGPDVVDGGRRLVDARGARLDLARLSSEESRQLWRALDDDGQTRCGVLSGRISASTPIPSVQAIAFWPSGRGEIPITLYPDGGFRIRWIGAGRPYRLELSAPGAATVSLVIPYQSGQGANWGVWLGAVNLAVVAQPALHQVHFHPLLEADASRPLEGKLCIDRLAGDPEPTLAIPVRAGAIEPVTLGQGRYRMVPEIPGWYASAQEFDLSAQASVLHLPVVMTWSRTLVVRLEDGRQQRCELQARPTQIRWADGVIAEVTARAGGVAWQAQGLPLAIARSDAPELRGLRIATAIGVGDQIRLLTTGHSLQVVDLSEPVDQAPRERRPTAEELRTLIRSEAITDGSAHLRHGAPYDELTWMDGPGGRLTLPTTPTREGFWYLHALYASGDSRPCRIVIDGQIRAEGFDAATTGFTKEHVRAAQVGPVWLGAQSQVELAPVGYSPHFLGFLWSQDGRVRLLPDDLAAPSVPVDAGGF